MPFTFYSPPSLTPEQMNPYNAAVTTGLQRMKQGIDLEYAPLEKYAQAASRLTYHNLMGPQFLASAMKNDKFLASLSKEQQDALAPYLVNAVNSASMPQMQPREGLLTGLASWVKGLINPEAKQQPQAAPNQQGATTQNAPIPPPQVANLPPNQPQAAPNTAPQTNTQPQDQPQSTEAPSANEEIITPEVQKAMQEYMSSPEAKADAEKNGYYKIPAMDKLVEWYKNKHAEVQAPKKNLAERTGEFAGIVKEGEKAGEIRAQDIKDLGGVIEQGQTAGTTLKALGKIVNNPELEKIRKLPLAEQHEFAWYAKHGTKDQQRLVGDFYDVSGEVLTNAAGRFKGAFRKGEQHLVNSMKPNAEDTVYTMQGKVRSMMYLNEMMTKRAQMVSNLMEDKHISKSKALEIADKKLDGDKIRKQVEITLHPKITIINGETGEKRTVPYSEALALGALG